MNPLLRLLVLILGISFYSVLAVSQEPVSPWTKSVPVEDLDTLQAFLDSGNLHLIPSEGTEVVVKATGIAEEDFPRIIFESKGKTVKLEYRGNKDVKPANFEVHVPATFHLNLDVSGDVATEANLGGNLKIITQSGDIDLADVNGSLTASTDSGEIYLKNVSGSASLTAKDGDIDVEEIGGDLELNNEEGDSYAKKVNGSLSARSSEGDITIGEIVGNANIDCRNGDVMVRKASGLTTITTGEGEIDLSQTETSIVITSGSGDISLKAISGPFEVKSEKGAVFAEILPGRTGKGKINSKEGDLEVFIPEAARITILASIANAEELNDEEGVDPIGSDFEAKDVTNDGTSVRGEYVLNGGGDTIWIETGSGSIQIKKLATEP